MAKPSLAGAFAKLDRAIEHASILEAEVYRAIDEGDLVTFTKTAHRRGEFVLFVYRVKTVAEVTFRAGAILGDILQNLRAALEHVAWELVKANDQEPIDRVTGFPLVNSPKAFKNAKSKLKGINDDHVRLIEGVQPYEEREGQAFTFLRLLQELARKDRHQIIQPVRIVAEGISPDVRAVTDCTLAFPVVMPTQIFEEPLRPGMDFLTVPVVPTGPNPDVHMLGEIKYFIALPERIDEESIGNSVGGMVLATWGVLETFR